MLMLYSEKFEVRIPDNTPEETQEHLSEVLDEIDLASLVRQHITDNADKWATATLKPSRVTVTHGDL